MFCPFRLEPWVALRQATVHRETDSTLSYDVVAGADPDRARHFLGLLRETDQASALAALTAEQGRVLGALLGGSQASGELLLAHPDWLPGLLELDRLKLPGHAPDWRQEVDAWLEPLMRQRELDRAFGKLRLFKQRQMLRIAARDLAQLAAVGEITRELSDLAEVCLQSVFRLVGHDLGERLGRPWHLDAEGDWQPTRFCVLGLGKLGGQELNYSSDVDVLFVYSEEGAVGREAPRPGGAPPKGLANHQFFKRLAEAFVAEVGRLTPEGMLYRIDLRLRPEGNHGPLARSLASYENYYAQWGQTWERMMLIKARCVAGDRALAGEFLETVQPFRYPRLLSEQALREIASMKQRIENEVVRTGELERNVKLGRGGIREIEFIAQALQTLHVGKQPFLADPQTVSALTKLVRYELLPAQVATDLTQAYEFLRALEHRLQMENNLQTHTIPEDRAARRRLASLMGFASQAEFEAALAGHRRRVRAAYEGLLQLEAPASTVDLPPFEANESVWRTLLANHAFRDPDKALRLITALVQGPGFGHVSPRTEDFGRQLVARLLSLCPRRDRPELGPSPGLADGDPQARWLSDPDRVVARLDSFIGAYGARALLFETWVTNPSLFELLVLLFDRSEFLAETAIRTPDLVDELELSGYLRRAKSAEQTLADLRHGIADADQPQWLRRYHQTELMRIGLRDILGLADFEQNLVELSALADACLQYALEAVLRRHKFRKPPLAIIGLGKLGGRELNYGSDLDILFVASDRTRSLAALQRVAVEVIELVSAKTELGVAFQLDARLRPDGEKGLLVNTLAAYGEYYRQRGRLWEIQAISRARWVAGNSRVGVCFEALVAQLADFSQPATAAKPASDPAWRQEIDQMRLRIEKERTPPGKDALAIKTGVGGLMDAEFIAQTLCLGHGWLEPNTLEALRRARDEGGLPAAAADRLILNFRKLRRVEGILRRWSYEGETELPDDPAPLYRVAVRCGFAQAEDFMRAVARYRANLRRVYSSVFSSDAAPVEPPGASG
ncbi:MAG: bifunctional [glutamate--ammonia ligase]-adenylyl-L-tyrosine phosphorylase/[glutamate--ammonia-ligase] adenylyltransferase [Verrucomicrobia bacterium]|nr:bifunctional [glutamate--ammonia ligase]-adenylyl-L-tyrosine phosphorylase/[glutamate--ammonia-ligase] adenylyltransferase [Verrucomicrobiota bacterium]